MIVKDSIFWIACLSLLIGMTSCVPGSHPTTGPVGNLPTPTLLLPTIPSTSTANVDSAPPPTELPFIYSIDMIECNLQSSISSQNYALDQIILKQSTQEDVRELLGEPEDTTVNQELTTWWWFGENYAWVTFRNEIAVRRAEPRFLLGEVVAHYGVPSEVVWRIPIVASDEIWFSTFLLYPEQGILFEKENQVVQFSSDTSFPEGVIMFPSEFDDYLKEKQILTSPYFKYEVFPWPCS